MTSPETPQNNAATDALSERLVAGLKPVNVLRASSLWVLGCAAMIACAVWVIVVYGLRPQLRGSEAFYAPMAVLKPALFAAVGILSLSMVAVMAHPQGQPPRRTLIWLSSLLGGVVVALIWQWVYRGGAVAMAPLSQSFALCWQVILTGGIISYAVIWAAWLRRAAPAQPVMFGALSSLAIASLMASSYALHCDRDMPLYILVYYGAPLAIMAGLGALAGRWLYRW